MYYTMLCILLYLTLHYRTPPGVSADEVAINTSNACQESMCTKVGITVVCYTMLCILLYLTSHYLTPLGVSADEVGIHTSNAFQESMWKCSKMLYKFDYRLTYKLSLKTCRGPARAPCRGLSCTRSVHTELMFSINVLDHSY